MRTSIGKWSLCGALLWGNNVGNLSASDLQGERKANYHMNKKRTFCSWRSQHSNVSLYIDSHNVYSETSRRTVKIFHLIIQLKESVTKTSKSFAKNVNLNYTEENLFSFSDQIALTVSFSLCFWIGYRYIILEQSIHILFRKRWIFYTYSATFAFSSILLMKNLMFNFIFCNFITNLLSANDNTHTAI